MQGEVAGQATLPAHAPYGAYHRLAWDDETLARFWRWQAQFPEDYFTNVFGAGIARGLAPWLRGGDGSVLDYGCGLGFLARHLVARGLRVWAADFSPEAVEATRRRNAHLAGFEGAFAVGDLIARRAKFSRILSVEVIEHLDAAAMKSYFASVRRLLAPGGRLIVTTPNEERLAGLEVYCPSCDHVFHRYQHLRSFTAWTLAETLTEHGLQPVAGFPTDFRRRPPWHPGQLVRNARELLLGRPRVAPHLVCIATAD
jgi:2-polyprenyl-3-methyl-5-hydroxy-6-metoxy-1,4-benzoquinol methylase